MVHPEISTKRWIFFAAAAALYIQLLSSLALAASLAEFDKKTDESEGPIVQTQYGDIQGVYLEKGREARAFLGVPFAAPPVGEFRWRAPQELQPWDGVYSATKQPAGCPQECGELEPESSCPPEEDESCLYLNVYTPRDANTNSNLPVMFWLHGGNFQTGGAGGILYDGRYIANMSQVVLVTANYRLGALGFMVTSDGLTGNYGFLDQQAALRFVSDNIAGFGGNPNKVTMFGQSAGAQSIAVHLLNDESEPLFHQAILVSNPFTIPYQTPTRAAELGDYTASLLGCEPNDLTCLKSRPAEEVLTKSRSAATTVIDPDVLLQVFEPWIMTIDGDTVPDDPLPAFQAGNFQRKPMIIGTTSEEGVLYIYEVWPESPGFLQVYGFLYLILKDREGVRSVLDSYGVQLKTDLRESVSMGCTDYIFGCSSRNASRELHHAGVPVYNYIFDHAFSYEDGWGEGDLPCKGRVCHGGDLPFIFRTASFGGYRETPAEVRLTDSILSYYANFAHTGDPNNAEWSDVPREVYEYWPEYSPANNWPSMALKTPRNQVQQKYIEEFCDLWDELGYEE